MAEGERRGAVLGAVKNPLLFFSLALLMIEGIIGVVVALSKMTGEYQFVSVCVMAFLFLGVVLIVAYITIKWPRHLYEEIAKELETTRKLKEFVNSPAFGEVLEDMLRARVRAECLRPTESKGNET